jgi:hypothetical protein
LRQRTKIQTEEGKLTHVGGNEHPLRKLVVRHVFFKQCEILDIRNAFRTVGYRFIDDQGAEK